MPETAVASRTNRTPCESAAYRNTKIPAAERAIVERNAPAERVIQLAAVVESTGSAGIRDRAGVVRSRRVMSTSSVMATACVMVRPAGMPASVVSAAVMMSASPVMATPMVAASPVVSAAVPSLGLGQASRQSQRRENQRCKTNRAQQRHFHGTHDALLTKAVS
jgi:hypothetical protein